jgi:hypothetical protein
MSTKRKFKFINQKDFLSLSDLKNLPTKNLLRHYRSVRATYSFILNYYGERCCEECHEYVGCDWGRDVGQHANPVKEYKCIVKKELDSRPDQFTCENKPNKINKPKTIKIKNGRNL